MQEVVFLKENAGKWKRLEAILKSGNRVDPDQAADLFIEITNDLSYSQTFFPNSKTTVYLNSLAAQLYQTIYKNRKEERSRLLTFWTSELPTLFYQYHQVLLVSFVLFFGAFVIGAVSAANDDTFVRLILGDHYVNMTLDNIEKGDPMGVYKQSGRLEMFIYITFNNVMVALRTFVSGILVTIGTVMILLYNGIMIGSFQFFFYQKGLLIESALTVWIHGTMEIFAIIVAGCAGIVLGNSFLFPGTYTRRQSLMRGAKDALKIWVGLIPVFILAGFLEGFVTRLTGMPVLLKLTIIVGSLSFMLWYFIIYPVRLNRVKSGSEDQSDLSLTVS